MPSPYAINIVDGVGSQRILNGSYNITADVTGYDNLSIDPNSQTVSAGLDTYNFTMAATGTLVLHVTEEGTSAGTVVPGASFVRCDSAGNPYGTPVVSDVDGNATFSFVPFAESNAPNIYFRQTASAGDHEFDDALQTVTLATATDTIEVENPLAALRTINLTDANYSGLPVESGELTFTEVI